MYYFSERSLKNLSTCHEDIRKIMNEAIKEIDFSVICGYRNKAEQDKAYNEGYSKVKFPNSRHNKFPSKAIDIIPYPFLGWDDEESFRKLSNVVKRVASDLEIDLNWGGDWVNFVDMPHYQLED